MTTSVAFVSIGGPHQVFHLAPVAAALSSDSPEIDVHFFASDERSLALARKAAAYYPGAKVRFERLRPARLAEIGSRLARRPNLAKLPTLWRNRRALDRFDAMVVAECTSTALRQMGVRKPKLLCVPHGAGDRAVSFELRFALFDRVLVAGIKTAERMVAAGIPAGRVVVTGYPKVDLARRMLASPKLLFNNDLLTVLFTPHFRASLSSLDMAPDIIAALTRDRRFNVIFAPHLRASEGASAKTIAAWRGLAVPGRVIVDLGSDRLIDMSYTAASNIYLGDVSSQVYEFLLRPRPCVFVNAHGVRWADDPDYALWNLGEVVAPDAVMAAVARATDAQPRFLAAQQAAVAATFADVADAALITARAVREMVPQ